MQITQPTLTKVEYDSENALCICTVKYSVLGEIKVFEPIRLDAAVVVTRNTDGSVIGSMEICRSMCQEALNMPVVLYSPQ